MPRNITVSFDDGTQHVYQNAPDDATPEAVQERAQRDFSKKVVSLDGGRAAPAAEAPQGAPGTGFQIPQEPGAAARVQAEAQAQAAKPKPGPLDTILGSVETGLSVLSGGTTGMAGGILGVANEIGARLANTLQGKDISKRPGAEQSFLTGMQAGTYAPRTESGQEQTGAVGEALATYGPALMGLGPEVGMLGKGLGTAAQAFRDTGTLRPQTAAAAAKVTAAKLAQPELEGIRAAYEAGYKLTPKAAKAGVVARTAETAAGAPRLAQELSAHNAENTARLARRDVGLPDDVPATPEATAAIRKEAGQNYAFVKDVGKFELDKQYSKDLDTIIGPRLEAAKDFPELADNPIIKKVEALRKEEVNTASAIEVVKDLRNEADKAFRAGDKKLGADYRAAASAVDNAMDRALGKMAEKGGDPALAEAVDKYRAARVRIAKTYLLDDAMDGKPGEVNARVYGRALDKGVPLTGEARQIAEFAKQFGDEGLAQKKGRSGAVGPTFHDIVLGALVHAPSAIAGGAAIFARPAARALLGSEFAQKRMAGSKPLKEVPPTPEPAAVPAPVRLTTSPGVNQPPKAAPEPGPLGDLTPNWETAPGASPGPAVEALPAEGLVPAVGETRLIKRVPAGADLRQKRIATAEGPQQPGIVQEPPPPIKGGGAQIPAVPGRPDLPETMVVGPPKEVGATAATGAAMQTPEAALARRQQAKAAEPEPLPVPEVKELPNMRAYEAAMKSIRKQHGAINARLVERISLANKIDPKAIDRLLEKHENNPVRFEKAIEEIIKKGETNETQAKQTGGAGAKPADADVQATGATAAAGEQPGANSPAAAGAERSEGAAAGGQGKREAGGGATAANGGKPTQAKGGHEALDLALPKIDEAFMREQQRVQLKEAPAPSERGITAVRKVLEEGAAKGAIDKDGAALALWALDKNPNLARGIDGVVEGLKVQSLEARADNIAKGSYNSASQIITLVQGKDNPRTAMHEILHHSERMMPDAVQDGIRRAWERARDDAISKASPEQKTALEDMRKAVRGDTEAQRRVRQAVKDEVINPDEFYQYVDPSEWWAVNGARIMHERFTGRGSWRAQARQWLQEMFEHIKDKVGLRSDAPILTVLNEMLNPEKNTGQMKSETLIAYGRRERVPEGKSSIP
jgi:hypothetical protein